MFDMLLKQLIEAAGGADKLKTFLDEWAEMVETVRELDARVKRIEAWQTSQPPSSRKVPQ
jgi:hypothetical protein